MIGGCFLAAFLTWSPRRWVSAALVAAGTYLFFGATTATLANPVFGRSVPPPPWSPGVLMATAALSGLLAATYVRNDGPALIRLAPVEVPAGRGTARAGALGSLLAYLAIGCPVCNRLALLLLGSTGALTLYAPIQPYLGAAGLALLALALVVRLRGEVSCASLATGRRPGAGDRPLTTDDILARLPRGPQGDGAAPRRLGGGDEPGAGAGRPGRGDRHGEE